MRLHAVVLFCTLLLGTPPCPASEPAAAATTAVHIKVVTDDGHTLALWGKAPPAPPGSILLRKQGSEWTF